MKIGIFTNNYLPNPYGVPTSIETFRRELEKRGHAVFIFAPHWKEYKDSNPNVFRYPSVDIEIKFRFPLAIPYSWKMDKVIKNLDLDVIYSQHPNLLGSAAMKWAKKLSYQRGKKIPLIFTWHTLYDHYAHFVKFLPERLVAKYAIRNAVNYANRSDMIIAPTDSIIPILRKWGVKKEIIPIATGVVEEEFLNANRELIRQKFGVEKDETLLFLASRLTSEKNIIFVINSVKNILREKKNIKLLILGNGYLKKDVEKIAKEEGFLEKIFFVGEVLHSELKNYYACSDIFIYGSKSETQGIFVMEAMYMGLPIVALSATGINSLVLNNGNGFLVSEKESEFEEAVLKLITDKDLRKKFGETSARIARQNFTASICAEKMLEVYEKFRTTD